MFHLPDPSTRPTRQHRRQPGSLALRLVWLTVLAAGGFWPGAAAAVTPATLVGPDLEPQRVTVTALRQGVLSYFDSQRQLRGEPVTRFVQLRFDVPSEAMADSAAATTPAPEPAGVIELVDGSRLVGQIASVTDDGQHLQWREPNLGVITLALDDMAAASFKGPLQTRSSPPAAGDRVELHNGDVIEGFVESLVQVRLAGQAEPVTLPIDRVQSLRLSNPSRPGDAPLWVTLRNGSRLPLKTIQIASDEATLELNLPGSDQSITLSLETVGRIDFHGGGRRLVALTDLPRQVISGGRVFGVPWPPRVSDMTLHLHAPIVVRFELPQGTTRLAAVAQLDVGPDVPAHVRRWADFDLLVRVDDRSLQRVRIDDQSPESRLNLSLDGRVLLLELDPGVNGPVMDRLRLRDAMLLIEEP